MGARKVGACLDYVDTRTLCLPLRDFVRCRNGSHERRPQLAFNDTWQNAQEILVEDTVVLIRGNVSGNKRDDHRASGGVREDAGPQSLVVPGQSAAACGVTDKVYPNRPRPSVRRRRRVLPCGTAS